MDFDFLKFLIQKTTEEAQRLRLKQPMTELGLLIKQLKLYLIAYQPHNKPQKKLDYQDIETFKPTQERPTFKVEAILTER